MNRTRVIVAVFYSVLFETFWRAVLEGGASEIGYVAVWLFVMAISSAIYGAVAGGMAQLLRSNKALQGARSSISNNEV